MKTGKRIVCIGLAIVLSVSAVLPSIAGETAQMLTAEQKNAIAMLNYITVLTQDINKSKNSKVYMENAYSNLVNNIYPNSVDDRTLDQLQGLLDTMERYRMIDVKREVIRQMDMPVLDASVGTLELNISDADEIRAFMFSYDNKIKPLLPAARLKITGTSNNL